MNYWFWLLIILTPIIVFSVRPEANIWLRAGRLALAVGLSYILMNLALHLSVDRGWEAHNSCTFTHSGHEGPYERSLANRLDAICPEAPDLGIAEGLYLYFGWIPAAAFIGFWELLWRLWHRKIIRATGNAFKGKWASNALIFFSTPVWLYILILLTLAAYTATCNGLYPDGGDWLSPNDKCWLIQ